MFKTLLGILFVLLSGTALAQTGDGMPPPNEGVCDELWGGTPGLYGLCVAFSEAQDCEPDFNLGNPFENCNPSNPKLLKIYNNKKTNFDPPMPGLGIDCPCWTGEDLDDLASPPDWMPRCDNIDEPQYTVIGWGVQHPENWWQGFINITAVIYDRDPEPYIRCGFVDKSGGQSSGGLSRVLDITEDEFVACAADVVSSGIVRDINCWD